MNDPPTQPLAHDGEARLPNAWRAAFFVEIPIVLATVIYWLAAPRAFLQSTFGLADANASTVLLLFSYTSVVATTVLWFYFRLLLRPVVHWPTFRAYQEALLLGDAGVVAIWAYGLYASALPRASAIGGAAMAALWGCARIAFLATAKPGAEPTERARDRSL